MYYVPGTKLCWETSSDVVWTSLVVNVCKFELSSLIRNVDGVSKGTNLIHFVQTYN